LKENKNDCVLKNRRAAALKISLIIKASVERFIQQAKNNMQNSKSKLFYSIGLPVFAALIVAGATYAAQGNSVSSSAESPAPANKTGIMGMMGGRGQFFSENSDAVLKAIESNDYNAWKKLMEENSITSKITKDNFAKFSEMHKLMKEGKTDEANAIRTELGLGQGRGMGMHGKKGGCGCGKAEGEKTGFVDENKNGICDTMEAKDNADTSSGNSI
jgi:hypothetical protein